MRVYLTSLGCKLNQSEIEMLARQFARAGHQPVSRPELADLCVVNSCTVTHLAARKSRQLIRRLHRANPRAPIVVTGCYAEMSPATVGGIEGVELVVGNERKGQLVEAVVAVGAGLRPASTGIRDGGLEASGGRTRAFVKIQDGCNNRCAYCIVTLARGQEWSRPIEEVLSEVRDRVAAGCKEAVLTGVNIGAYGRERDTDLAQLVRLILAETDLPRLRLSSIEPWDLNDELLALWEDSRLCRHLHLPLQSGCDETLRRMSRHYTATQYAALIERAQAAVPGLAVTTDLIAGFPGETEAEFAQSRAFVERMAFARLHVFPYSPRPGTPAAQFPDQVPPPVKRQRAQRLRAIGEEASRSFRQQFVGQILSVLWEGRQDRLDAISGLTDNYLRVYTSSEEELANTITPVRMTRLHADGLWGQPVLARDRGGSPMNSRERVLTTLAGGQPDRVPVALSFYRIELEDMAPPGALIPGDVDVHFVRFQPSASEEEFGRFVQHIPRDTHLGRPELLRTYAEWRYRPGQPEAHPLAQATTPADLEAFPWPDITAEYRSATLREQVETLHQAGYAVGGGPPHLGGELFETAWRLRGLARFLLDLEDNPSLAHALLDRLADLCRHNALLLAQAGVDILVLDDDVGMPETMILHPQMWRTFLRPRMASIIEAARAVKPDLRVLYHSDGVIEPIIGDLIEIGVDALNPVQPDRMDPQAIKQCYGDRLTLWGAVGVHTTFARATPDQIRAEVRHRLETLGPRRFVLCPAYDIDEPDTPWENVAAFLEAASRYGSVKREA